MNLETALSRKPHLRWHALGFLALWLTFSVAYAVPFGDDRHTWFGGDQAQLLSVANQVLDGRLPLTGAPSREGVSHPGPLFAYVLATIQSLTSGRESWSIATVSFLQAATVPLLGLLCFRLSSSLVLAVTLPLVFVLNYHFLLYMRFLWNVSVITPALALGLLLTLYLDRVWALPALAGVLSLVAQAHMGFAPLALWIGVVALAYAWQLLPRGERRKGLLLTLLVVGVAWAPVVWDAVVNRGGNPARLVARFSTHREAHPPGEVLGALEALVAESIPAGPALRRVVLAGSAVALLIVAAASRPGSVHQRRFAVVIAGAWVVFLWSMRAIPEPIQTYYLRPVVVLVAATVIAGAASVLSALREGWPRALFAGILAVVALVVSARPAVAMRRLFGDTSWNSYPLSEMRVVVQALMDDIGSVHPGVADVEFVLSDGAEPAFLYLLERRGVARRREPGASRFRLSAASGGSPAGDPNWKELCRTGRYRLERWSGDTVWQHGGGRTVAPC